MELYTVHTGFFKLDGGAMFGVVPKVIWQELNPPDENNLCSWAMRCLLIVDGKRIILIDNGIGNKQDKKFFSLYYLHGEESLEKSLHALGLTPEDVTDVVLTHLHFDHCGGSIQWNKDRTGYEPAFKNARYWSHADHWQWATHPNDREKASFLKENILPIEESGQLCFINGTVDSSNGFELITQNNFHADIAIAVMRGHTDAMMLPVIPFRNTHVVFAADLLPSAAHIPIPYVMAYDTRPLITMAEKKAFLQTAFRNQWKLFFEHDPVIECCTLKSTERGMRMDHSFRLDQLA
jgi:glyoxylase-like metal-dependent hydrolase (beta-lactamase superfamily II)